MTLRESFQKQLEKPGQQCVFWPKVFYLMDDKRGGHIVMSMLVSEIDTCGLALAQDQRDPILPLLCAKF